MATQVASYTPREILAYDGPYLQVPGTIAQGQVLLAGQVLAQLAASGKLVAYAAPVTTNVTLTAAQTQNVTLTTGSATATPTSLTNLAVGQAVTGTGIPASTTVTAIDHVDGTITLSAAATATGSESLTFAALTTATPASMTGLAVGQTVSGTGITAGTTVTAVGATTITLSAVPTTSGVESLTFTDASGQQTPCGLILDRNVDSTNQDEPCSPFVNGNFVAALLTNYDATAAAAMGGRTILNGTVVHIP